MGPRSGGVAALHLARWPELALLQRAKAQTVRDFYQAHNVRRPELIKARLRERKAPLLEFLPAA